MIARAIMIRITNIGLNSCDMDLIRKLVRHSSAWPVFAALLIVFALYNSSIATLCQKWVKWDQDLAHALPTIALMFALLWRRDYAVSDDRTSNLLYGALLVATASCSIGWYLFESLSISLPAYVLLIATLCCFIGAALSPSAILGTLPILGLLLFTIPAWSELTSILVTVSTLAVGHLVRLSNLTVLIDGSSLFIPSGTIHIADGCSGIRYLIISVLMGYILILINQYKPRTAIITLLAACALGLFANWLRIYLLVLIGYYTEMQSSLMHDHETFGWILFACLLIPAMYFAPINRHPPDAISIAKRPRFLALVAVSIGPLLLYINTSTPSPYFPLQLSHLDALKITTSEPIGTELSPRITRVDERLIELEGIKIRVDLFAHTPSSAREEIVPYIQGLTDRSNWSIEQSYSQSKFNLAIYKKVGGNTRVVIATQYVVGKIETEKYIAAKFLQLVANAAGDKYFGLLAAQTNCASDCQDELNRLTRALDRISVPQS